MTCRRLSFETSDTEKGKSGFLQLPSCGAEEGNSSSKVDPFGDEELLRGSLVALISSDMSHSSISLQFSGVPKLIRSL
jgi:hypothetical protein